MNDASCLIDLRKGGLLEALCRLPYRLVIPLPVRESEVLHFSGQEWQYLDRHGMTTYDLTPAEVEQALALKDDHCGLSANDCLCLVTALANRGILLTGDAQLRKVANRQGLRVHGVLWVVDELAVTDACPTSQLMDALKCWQSDNTVFLPRQEIAKRLRSLEKLP
ncbi:MAG: PIN domain-containing protein [Gemmatimonadota bacterium]|nr:PIN domain-containing protein [Gemmatimonadota bacterium]